MGESPTASEVWSRRAELVWRRVGDEGVILDPDGRMMRGVNLTAFEIWDRLDGTRTLARVGEEIAATYGVPLSTATADVVQFVDRLRQARLVEKAGGR